MTLGEFREQTKGLSDDLVLEFYSERYNDSTQPTRLEFNTEGYVEFVINDDRWSLGQAPCEGAVSKKAVGYIIKSHIHEIITESGTDKNAHTNAVLRAINNLVDAMPSVTPTQTWISVSERLPKEFSYVNCTCHSLIDDREDWVVETCYIPQLPNSPYSDWGNIPMLNSCECEVIAWMYRDIPKPYKAESEE